MTYDEAWAGYLQAVNDGLSAYPFEGAPETCRDAMRYSLLSPGKRLRGILCLAAADSAGGSGAALPCAMALEMVHAYSLIHDDLPAMDNDSLRRGKPTNHIVYGEAMAILAGDGLLTEAFSCLASAGDDALAGRLTRVLSLAAGAGGMVGGQALDIENATPGDYEALRRMEALKTGCLIRASVELGLVAANADETLVEAGRRYGSHLGLAFQLIDDLLDVKGTQDAMGKTLGKDAREGKTTAVSILGLEGAFKAAQAATDEAIKSLAPFGERGLFLRETAKRMLSRVS
ncbi:MAG: polyprenyl synthetase family protein [Clostridia bacterium]|nr:polyprenyl synthetase family protein [Clostridia bacterium]